METAEEFEEKHFGKFGTYSEMMSEFAKYHVKLALETIFEEAKHGDQEHQDWLKEKFNSYNLENIK